MERDQQAAETMKRIRERLGGLRHGERMQRLQDERKHTESRLVARELDEMIAQERSAFMKRVWLKIAGWGLVLAVIFFILIKFGSPTPTKDTADKATSTKVAASKPAVHAKKKAHVSADKKRAQSSAQAARRAKAKSSKAASASKVARAAKAASAAKASSAAKAASVAKAASAAKAASVAKAASAAQAAKAASAAKASSAAQAASAVAASSAAAAQQAAAASASRAAATYTAQAGDNLYRIAVNHGLTLDQLLQLNGMTEGASLVPGQTLRLQ